MNCFWIFGFRTNSVKFKIPQNFFSLFVINRCLGVTCCNPSTLFDFFSFGVCLVLCNVPVFDGF